LRLREGIRAEIKGSGCKPEPADSRHSREGGNPGARNFLKRMDSRLRTPDYEFRGQASGMTAMKRTFCDVVNFNVGLDVYLNLAKQVLNLKDPESFRE